MRVVDERAPINGFVIQKGVPIPRVCKFPFERMQPGDSFEVAIERRRQLRSALWYHLKKKRGGEFVTRTIDEKRVRCWRVR